MTQSEAIVKEIFDLYRGKCHDAYYGDKVTKLSHSLQCGTFAALEGASDELILAAFLHDIGHVLGVEKGLDTMNSEGVLLGSCDHAAIGAEYLARKGFGPQVTEIVLNHVEAKRYLFATNPDYATNLSWASRETLKLQGGPMTEKQAASFEKHPLFTDIIQMRHWDDKGKESDPENLKSLQYFETLTLDYLKKSLAE